MNFDMAMIQADVGQTLQEAGTLVQISWVEWPSDSTIDPVTQSRTGTPIPKTQNAMGLIHFPEPRMNSSIQQFQEIEIGDCIVDFGSDVALDGKDRLTFLFLAGNGTPIDGQVWVAKPTSERLARTWGLIVQGQTVFRRVLLRKQT